MRRFFIILALSLLPLAGSAADPVLRSFTARADTSLVSFSYSFQVPGQVTMKGSGIARVQGDSFFLSGNGIEVWCDGSERWTIDRQGREAVVEAIGQGGDFATDPALLVASVEEVFREVSSGKMLFGGKTCHGIVLAPKADAGSVSGLKLYFSGERLCGLEVTVQDGTKTEFVISGISFSDRAAASTFKFDSASLDDSWAVTDFR